MYEIILSLPENATAHVGIMRWSVSTNAIALINY